MSYLTPKFNTENIFSNVCTVSQQHLDIEDNTRLRMGNNSGNPRLASRDILDGGIANNDYNRFEKISGSSANQFKYFPSTASPHEKSVNSKEFDNLAFTSPNLWKNHRYNHKQTSGETSGVTNKRNEKFSSSTAQQNGPYDLEKEINSNNKKEGFCGCNNNSMMNKAIPCTCIVAVVVLIIVLLFIFIKKPCNNCNDCCENQSAIKTADELYRSGIFLM